MSRTHKSEPLSRPRKRKFPDDEESSVKEHKKSARSKKPKSSESTPKQPTGPAKERTIDHDESISKRDPALMADFFAQKIAKHYGDSTSIEQQDMSIPKSWLTDTTDFDESHIASNLSAYLEKFTNGGRETLSTCEAEASPHTLIIASSGIRVADLVRELRVYNTDTSKVGKFIAKHMKLKENIEYLAKTKVGIAVATPARLKDLIEQKAMKLDDMATILIDASYLDEKKRALTDMADLFKPLVELLHHETVKSRLKAGTSRLLVF